MCAGIAAAATGIATAAADDAATAAADDAATHAADAAAADDATSSFENLEDLDHVILNLTAPENVSRD